MLVAFDPFGIGNLPDWAATATCIVLDFAFTLVYFVLVEHAVTGFRRLHPQYCSMMPSYVLAARTLLESASTAYIQLFNGTPYKSLIWRLLGVRNWPPPIQRRLHIVERSLVSVGSDVHAERGNDRAGPFPRRRHLQIRPHHDWRRLHHRHRCLRPLRDHHRAPARYSAPIPSL